MIDVFGRVETPFYALKPEDNFNLSLDAMLGKVAFIPEGSKTLTEEDIKSLKAKSSAFEQEVDSESSGEDEREELSMDFKRQRGDRKRRDSYD